MIGVELEDSDPPQCVFVLRTHVLDRLFPRFELLKHHINSTTSLSLSPLITYILLALTLILESLLNGFCKGVLVLGDIQLVFFKQVRDKSLAKGECLSTASITATAATLTHTHSCNYTHDHPLTQIEKQSQSHREAVHVFVKDNGQFLALDFHVK